VKASTDEDPTGRQLLWLAGGILGRSDDMVTVRGNNVFPSSVEAVLREIDAVAEFRIDVKTVRAMHELCITVEPTTEALSEGLQTIVTDALRKRLGFACEVTLAAPGELPRFELKGKRFFRQPEEK
jgi:phenylacetate-CoA ligase